MPHKGKGKARAAPSDERTPLLVQHTSGRSSIHPGEVTAGSPPRVHRRSGIYAALLVLLPLLGFLVLLGASFVPSDEETESLPDSFKYANPTVHIINISDSGVHVNLTLEGGVDVDHALAVDGRRGSGWWEGVRRSTAHAVFGVLPDPNVHVSIPALQVYERGGGLPLLNVTLPFTVTVPLVRGGELRPLNIEAVGVPLAPVGEIWTWAQKAWAEGSTQVVVGLPEAQARVASSWWSRWASVTETDLAFPLTFDVPELPNFPKPGKPLDLSSLVTLTSYTFTDADGLRISALASLPNPGVGALPFPLPFAIELEGTRMAEVVATTRDITFKKIHLSMKGDIVSTSSDALGIFLRRFLHGQDSPIVVRGLHLMPARYKGPSPPQFVLNTLPSLALDLKFPAPHPAPQIIRSVTVEGMRLGSSDSDTIAASGTVVALIQLPKGLESVNLNVSDILPDVLVYDGPAEEGEDRPDPSNPPPGAFAQIHPKEYLNSTTTRSDDPAHADGLVVRAPFENVPLDILEGREAIFRAFVSKVIFKGGANAGIGGVVDVRADLGHGDPIEIGDLPVTGEFWVGRSARMLAMA